MGPSHGPGGWPTGSQTTCPSPTPRASTRLPTPPRGQVTLHTCVMQLGQRRGCIPHLWNAPPQKSGVHSTKFYVYRLYKTLYRLFTWPKMLVPLIQNLVPLIHMAENRCTVFTDRCTAYFRREKTCTAYSGKWWNATRKKEGVHYTLVECTPEKGGGALHTCGPGAIWELETAPPPMEPWGLAPLGDAPPPLEPLGPWALRPLAKKPLGPWPP